MAVNDWSRAEVEAIVEDYLAMLALELSGSPYNKAEHRRTLAKKLNDRSEGSIEFKHANISAALIEGGFPYIDGYKPRANLQGLLLDVVMRAVATNSELLQIAAADADKPMPVPEVEEILGILTTRPEGLQLPHFVSDPGARPDRLPTDYLKREASNRSLGAAGEQFILNYERARLISSGNEALASRIEHTSKVRGDHEGYDILSFEDSGEERLIEVKTTKYGRNTPFYATRNEIVVSEANRTKYQVYRLFQFRKVPALYTLPGAISTSCQLSPVSFHAVPK